MTAVVFVRKTAGMSLTGAGVRLWRGSEGPTLRPIQTCGGGSLLRLTAAATALQIQVAEDSGQGLARLRFGSAVRTAFYAIAASARSPSSSARVKPQSLSAASVCAPGSAGSP